MTENKNRRIPLKLDGIESVNIGKKGESEVIKFLKSKGITIDKHDTKAPGATDIEASDDDSKYLIQVKAAKLPRNPGNMTSKDMQRIRSRVTRINASPYLFKVQFDTKMKVKSIKWSIL